MGVPSLAVSSRDRTHHSSHWEHPKSSIASGGVAVSRLTGCGLALARGPRNRRAGQGVAPPDHAPQFHVAPVKSSHEMSVPGIGDPQMPRVRRSHPLPHPPICDLRPAPGVEKVTVAARPWCGSKLRARRGARSPATRGVLSVRRASRATEQRRMATQIAAARLTGAKGVWDHDFLS